MTTIFTAKATIIISWESYENVYMNISTLEITTCRVKTILQLRPLDHLGREKLAHTLTALLLLTVLVCYSIQFVKTELLAVIHYYLAT